MDRKPRIHVPGGVYHVMLRGNGGQPVTVADALGNITRFEIKCGQSTLSLAAEFV